MTRYIIRAYDFGKKAFITKPQLGEQTDALEVFDDLLEAVDWVRDNEVKIYGKLMIEVDAYQK